MQIQSKHVAKPEDVKAVELLARKTAAADKRHDWLLVIFGILTVVNTTGLAYLILK